MSRRSIFRKFLNFAKRRRNTEGSSTQDNTMTSEEHNQHVEVEEKIYPIQILEDAVSTLHKCKSSSARKLCIFDIARKLEVNGHYNIGGTYDEDGLSELWFYYTTTTLPGYNYLLNLFVCYRKIGNISLEIQELAYEKEDEGIVSVYNISTSPSKVTFQSFQPDQHYFIKTFCFSEDDLEQLKQCSLYINFSLNFKIKNTLNKHNIDQMKLNHSSINIFKDEKTDFVLATNSGQKYPVHKVVLAAHSSILREAVKKGTSPFSIADISDEVMESVIQFLYTGTVKDILKKDCSKICEAAEKLGIDNLTHLSKISMRELAGGV